MFHALRNSSAKWLCWLYASVVEITNSTLWFWFSQHGFLGTWGVWPHIEMGMNGLTSQVFFLPCDPNFHFLSHDWTLLNFTASLLNFCSFSFRTDFFNTYFNHFYVTRKKISKNSEISLRELRVKNNFGNLLSFQNCYLTLWNLSWISKLGIITAHFTDLWFLSLSDIFLIKLGREPFLIPEFDFCIYSVNVLLFRSIALNRQVFPHL